MHNTHPRELEVYQTPQGQEPFTEWLASLRDLKTRRRIQARLNSLKIGNFGDLSLLEKEFLNCASTSGQVIESIMVKLEIPLFFYFGVAVSQVRHGTSIAQKLIGGNTRRHSYEKNENLQ